MVDRLRHTLTGAADRSHCCPALCSYRVEMVEPVLSYVKGCHRRGEDPVTGIAHQAPTREGGSRDAPGGSGIAHRITAICDVQRALDALGTGASAVEVARWLCPFALDDSMREPA